MILTKHMDYASIIDGKNILVTGGTGSFGRQLVKEISNLEISVLDKIDRA